MLGLLTHPIACLAYFFAFRALILRYLGDIRSTWGCAGRAALFAGACLGVSGSAMLIAGYRVGGGDPASNFGVFMALLVIVIPAALLVITLLGALVSALTKRHDQVFRVTTACMIGTLFAALWNLHGGL